ncbi:MAG: arginine--tRNA ligase [candidate division Zixibacteria bacterium]|nr:arginine--tRNA ligase [candidate division Zixibacteria bacterium]
MTTVAPARSGTVYFREVCESTAGALAGLSCHRSLEDVAAMYEAPDRKGLGDSAFPCFPLAKELKMAPQEIASQLAGRMERPRSVTDVRAIGGYLNVWYKPEIVAAEVLPIIAAQGQRYGSAEEGRGRTICMDYSHPNIAKPFGVGHLRSTVIGHSLKRILEKLGYSTIGINHLGDWGTQFGKLIVAFREWGDEGKLAAEPIAHLYDLYVRFHADAESDPGLEERARREFKKLEDGDRDNRLLWQRFRDLSLSEFERVYRRLGVTFDSDAGEAFYNERLSPLIDRLVQSGVARSGEDGALIIPIGGEGEAPLLLRKADGATLYATRDLAAAEYRYDTYHFDRCLYIVGSAQALHFQQLFAALKAMGHDWAERMVHVEFGWVKFADTMMSTRRGNIIFLDDVLAEAVERTKRIIADKNPALEDADAVAEAVGVGAVVFWQLSVKRQKDVNFDWDDALAFDGRTGPYLQYTHARLSSLLAKWGKPISMDRVAWGHLNSEEERKLVLRLGDWPRAIQVAGRQYEPQVLAAALLDTAQLYNTFYQKVRILDGEAEAAPARILLSDCVRQVLAEGLCLLGLQAPHQM